MSLSELKAKYHKEARKNSVGFWSPKIGDSLMGKIVESREVNGDLRWVIYNYPTAQYFILPNHGHLMKHLGGDPIGKYFYIELADEREITKGVGKGKMGKLYYVSELQEDEIKELKENEGVEDPIISREESSDDSAEFDF